MQIVLVEPNKAARPVEIEDNLHAMQALVGGPIQALLSVGGSCGAHLQ